MIELKLNIFILVFWLNHFLNEIILSSFAIFLLEVKITTNQINIIYNHLHRYKQQYFRQQLFLLHSDRSPV